MLDKGGNSKMKIQKRIQIIQIAFIPEEKPCFIPLLALYSSC